MYMYKSILAALIGLFVLGASQVAAFPEEGEPATRAEIPSFEELDRDGNGYISRSEAAVLPCLRDNFDDIDTRSDEGLDRSEYQQAVSEYC